MFWTLEVSPDGRFVDAVHGSGVARFDAATLELITDVDVDAPARTEENSRSDMGGISDLVHVPGSDDVVAVGRLGTIYRLDMTSGDVTPGKARDDYILEHVSVSGDGSVVAATSASGLSLFDAETLEPIGEPLSAVRRSESFFTDDGDLLADSRSGVSAWELDPDEWQATACRTAGRNLTRAEWAEYLGDETYRATCPEWPPASN